MGLREHFYRSFRYDAWANREALASLRSVATPPAHALELMAHIFSAEHVWMARLRKQIQPFPVWPAFSLEQCEQHAAKLPPLWSAFLDETPEADLTLTLNYSNTVGEAWSNRVEDILTHVIMHSAYHRGQLAQLMRAAGFTPAQTDYIHGVRQGMVE